MKRTKRFLSAVFGVAILFVAGSCAYAEQVANHGAFDDTDNGGAIMYVSVSESSETDEVPLYAPDGKPPEVVLNKLDFDPSFGSTVSGADGIDLTDGQVNVDFMMLPGSGVTSFSIMEAGAFSFFPSGGATAATSVGYGLNAIVTVLEVDGEPVEETFTVSANEAGEVNATEVSTPALGLPWELSVFIDLGPALSERGITPMYGVTKGEIVVDNTLASSSEAGTQAFIDKKDFMITPFGDLDPDAVIPEPLSATLLAAGLAVAALRRR